MCAHEPPVRQFDQNSELPADSTAIYSQCLAVQPNPVHAIDPGLTLTLTLTLNLSMLLIQVSHKVSHNSDLMQLNPPKPELAPTYPPYLNLT